jgi:hypothetical protein
MYLITSSCVFVCNVALMIVSLVLCPIFWRFSSDIDEFHFLKKLSVRKERQVIVDYWLISERITLIR